VWGWRIDNGQPLRSRLLIPLPTATRSGHGSTANARASTG
jgi:hypothetical protein